MGIFHFAHLSRYDIGTDGQQDRWTDISNR